MAKMKGNFIAKLAQAKKKKRRKKKVLINEVTDSLAK